MSRGGRDGYSSSEDLDELKAELTSEASSEYSSPDSRNSTFSSPSLEDSSRVSVRALAGIFTSTDMPGSDDPSSGKPG